MEGNKQDIRVGPVASLLAIKQLGSNGGGFYGANSAHPFENPTGLSNMYEMFLMLIIPLSFPIAYAKLIGKWRGISILIAMLISFGSLLIIAFTAISGPKLLETRFGNFGSILFNIISITTNTGAVNSSLLGMSPNAITSFFIAMFVQVNSRCSWNRNDDHDYVCYFNTVCSGSDGRQNTRIFKYED